MKIPKVEYEVYHLNETKNLNQLDLSACKDVKIEISIPVEINDNIDKYNSSSGYYNDLCYTLTSQYGTDICLKDRRSEFIDNNMTLCEENCKMIDYNYETEKVKCSCDIKIDLPVIGAFKFNKDLLLKSFTDINNLINLNVLKCMKNIFDNNLLYNIGFFIMAFIVLLYFISLIIFIIKSYK